MRLPSFLQFEKTDVGPNQRAVRRFSMPRRGIDSEKWFLESEFDSLYFNQYSE
jgi:hypothetical protein